jgi:hypothetical protein
MWYVRNGEKNFGPFPTEKMQALIKAGKLPLHANVWQEGTTDWVMLRDSSLMATAQPVAAAYPVAAAAPARPAVAVAAVASSPVSDNPFYAFQPIAQPVYSAAPVAAPAVIQPTAQQLANPYFSDYQGAQSATQPVQPALAAANPYFRLLPLEGRQVVVIGTSALAGVLSIVCALLTFQQIGLLKRLTSRAFAGDMSRFLAEAKASDSQFLVAFLAFVVAMLAMSISFLVWFYRAHVNAQALSPTKFADSSGMAVGNFFIPILNLFKPYGSMRDLWSGTFSKPASSLVGIWWATWVAMNILNRPFIFSLSSARPAPSELINLSYISLISNFLTLIPLGLTILIVLKITKQQSSVAKKRALGTA